MYWGQLKYILNLGFFLICGSHLMLFCFVKEGRTSEMSFHTDLRFACFKANLVNMPSVNWTGEIATSSYFPQNVLQTAPPQWSCTKRLKVKASISHWVVGSFAYVDIKSIQSLSANKTEMDLDVSKWNLDRHTKPICVKARKNMKISWKLQTCRLIGESVLKQAQFVHFLLNSSAIDIAKDKYLLPCTRGGFTLRHRCCSLFVDGFGKTSFCGGSTSQSNHGCFDLHFCFVFFCIMVHELGSLFFAWFVCLQENCNTPPEHTPGNPPSQLWKESLYSLIAC